MTSSATNISVSNQALLQIGARATIASFNEGSTESNAIRILYTPTFEMLARTADWNCLRQQATLTLIAAAAGTPENPTGATMPLPPTPWLYSYSTPSDNLQIRSIVPSNPNSGSAGGIPLTTASYTAGPFLPGTPAIPFVVGYANNVTGSAPQEIVLTNQSQAQCVYTVNQPNPIIWDSLFQQAFVSSLAAFLVPALSLNLPLMQASMKAADALIAQARIRDGDEGITVVDHIPDWMQARAGGGSLAWQNGGYNPYIYNGMIWPGV